jgi:hypothetical protein
MATSSITPGDSDGTNLRTHREDIVSYSTHSRIGGPDNNNIEHENIDFLASTPSEVPTYSANLAFTLRKPRPRAQYNPNLAVISKTSQPLSGRGFSDKKTEHAVVLELGWYLHTKWNQGVTMANGLEKKNGYFWYRFRRFFFELRACGMLVR